MKKILIYLLVFLSASGFNGFSQKEPACACNPAETILNLAGKKLVYSELSVNVLFDNSIMILDGVSGKYYKIKSGVQKGPLSPEDPEVAPFINQVVVPEDFNPLYTTYRDYIIKNAGKYQIKINGTTYGPYYSVNDFYITRSGDRFLAMVCDKEPFAMKIEKINQKINNAATEQEKNELQAQHMILVQEEIASGGDVLNNNKMVSNIPGAVFKPESLPFFNADAKFDEIVRAGYDENNQFALFSLSDKKLISINNDHLILGQEIFIKSNNSGYAIYGNGTLTFSDGTFKSEIFNPYLTKAEGRIFLTYMYYSPGKNSIMQCKLLF